MVIFLVFLTELFLLFLLSRSLQRKLSFFIFQLTKNERWTITALAFIFLPGTLIHELSHYFMAHLLLVPVSKIELLPKKEGDHIKLGSVGIGKTDPFRRLLIGVAPFLTGTSIILTILFLADERSIWAISYALPILVYTLFEIGNTMFSSRKDLEGALLVLIIILSLFATFYLLGLKVNLYDIEKIFNNKTTQIIYQGVVYLLLPLALDLVLILLFTISSRLLSR